MAITTLANRPSPATGTRPVEDRRPVLRLVAAALSGVVAVLYVVLLVLVYDAERGAAENTYGAYLFLAVIYVAGAVLLAVVDQRGVAALGVAVQVSVLTLFVLFGVGVFGPGVFEYEALEGIPVVPWASVITGLQVVLLGLVAYLVTRPAAPGSG